jgi:hypothetical protein
MSELTTEKLVVQCRQIADKKAEAMGNAGVPDRAAAYVGLKFEATGQFFFECQDLSNNGTLDLLDIVLDEVEQSNPVEFTPHRHGGGKQTVYWRTA